VASPSVLRMEGTPQPWSVAQIHALAPDAASQKAGVKLAGPAPWSGYATSPESNLIWGDCKGSGAKPYQVTIELSGPAYACTCPSRKFPCKHALGLLLLWSAGSVPVTDTLPQRVEDWQAGRRERDEKSRERKATQAQKAAQSADDPDAARRAAQATEKRATQRVARVGAGLDDLELWLGDQVRAGLVGLKGSGYRPIDDLARRLVDAQAPGVAARVRELASVLSAEQWPERTVTELAMLNLLIQGWRHRDTLPEPLAATVRRRVGITQTAEEITASGEHVTDRWLVLGRRDRAGDKLVERRVWLQGERTGRMALLLAFAPPGQSLGLALPVGASVEAELAFAPEAVPLRAVVVDREALRTNAGGAPPAPISGTLEDTATALAAAVAADPWTTAVPTVISAAVPVPPADGAGWRIVDAKSDLCVPLLPPGDGDADRAERLGYALLAAGGARPAPLFGEYRPAGFSAVTLWSDGRAVSLI
jgi:hypothetical protein